MDFVFSKGKVTRQAHVGIPEGTYEEEHGRETFFGRASHLYRMHPPTAWTRIDGTLRPRALDLNEMKPEDDDNFFFVIEGTGEFGIPDRGLMGRHAMFDPGVLEVPEPDPHDESGEFEVRVKRDGEFTSLFFAWHPLDVVGWQGDLCPVKLNILNHRPVYPPC